ncbi:hypothetical protein Gotur_032145 [Gossypium turneri]
MSGLPSSLIENYLREVSFGTWPI